MLGRAATERPDDPALRFEDATVSHGELRAEAGRLAAGLVAAGVRPGDRVAMAYPNSVEFVVAYLGILSCGAVAVPLNPSSPGPELESELAAVGPKLLLGLLPGATTVETVSGAEVIELIERAGSDLAALLFTAGTAGAPKAAMLTHGNLASNIDQVQQHPGMAIRTDDVALGVLPSFHIFGLNVVLGTALAAGACVVLAAEFAAAPTAALVGREHVTVVAGVPAMFGAWVDLAPGRESDFAQVRLAVSGAAALGIEIADSFRERYGVSVREGYGLTEASPIVTSTAVDTALRPGSIGPPLPGIEVRVVDQDGTDVLAGDPGEIWVRGPNVFSGYWGDDDATARVLTRDGWLRTGDVAVADDDGYLALVDRAKDLVIVSGFNVYPAEVEAALLDHPEVADVAVVGVTDARSGEALAAYIVPADAKSPPTDAHLAGFVAERLARYKVPATFELVAELPRSRLGKLLRRELGTGSDTP